MEKNKKESGIVTFLWFLLVVLLANIWAYFYVTKSKYIYGWDNALYWFSARSICEFKIDANFFKTLYESIGNSEYNMLPAVLPALVMKIFGTSRLTFIMSVVNLYFVPVAAVIFALCRRYFKRAGMGGICVILALPLMLFTGLVGFLDVGALFFAMLAMWLYFSPEPEKNMVLRYTLIGILLIIMMLFRRYFAFFALSFVTAMAGEDIIHGRKKKGIVIMLLVMGAIMLLGFRDFVFNQLLKNYGDLYSGYKFSIRTDMLLVTRYFGIIPLVLITVLSVWTYIKEKNTGLEFLWMQILLCFLMFVTTQTHGQQHLLLYVPSFIMMILFTVPKIENLYIKVLCGCIGLAISSNTLIDRVQPQSLTEIEHFAIIPDFSMRPRFRKYTDEILEVKQYLNETVGMDKKVGVLASGADFNDDLLRNCEVSLGFENPREDFFLSLPSVDSRDKDLSPLFNADYMVVVYPAQTHLGAENQRVIVEAVNCFYNETGFAKAFVLISEKMEAGNMDIYVYKRTRDVSEAEKSEFSLLFT